MTTPVCAKHGMAYMAPTSLQRFRCLLCADEQGTTSQMDKRKLSLLVEAEHKRRARA